MLRVESGQDMAYWCVYIGFLFFYIYISALNCGEYSTFEGMASYHRIVMAKKRLSLRRNAV